MATPVELVYGRSGMGKTIWLCRLAEHIWAKRKKKTRILCGDGGTQTILDYLTEDGENLVEEGVIEVYQYNVHIHPFETCQKVVQGFWPEDPDDPESEWIDPDYPSLATEFGMFGIEGLTAMSDYLMSYTEGGLAEQSGRKNIKLGGGLDAPFKLEDGGVTLGGVSQSGYGFVQRVMKTLIEQSRVLPNLVYWTSHQREVDDYDAKASIIGPNVAGKALTTTIGASFGNTVHLDTVSKTKKVLDGGKQVDYIVTERRAYWTEHYDPDVKNFIKYYANCRMLPDRIGAAFKSEFDRGWMSPPDPVRFYTMLASGRKHKQEENKND